MTKLSMTAPGLRDRAAGGAGLLPGELLLRVPQSTWVGGTDGSASGQDTPQKHQEARPAPVLLGQKDL